WTIHVPMTVTAVEGSCAVVPCHTQRHGRVIWYKYHNINYPVVYDQQFNQVEAPFRGRTSVIGKAAEGNCTLKIQDVTMADNNLRVYVWINPDSKATQKFHDQTVIIFVERRNPMISVQSVILEGSIFEVDCSIEHSCPYSPPSIQWHRSHFLQNFTSVTFSSKRGNLWLYRETLRGTATLNMHKTQIGCSAQFRTLTTTSPQATLNVFGQPANVKIELKKAMIIEGGSITANCAANSYPLPHTYSWIIRQMGINSEINSTQRIMSFHNITRNTSLSCMAYNDVGVGQSDWMDLLVQYAPAILPESSCSLMEDLIRCFCHVEAFPFASISWDVAGNYSHLSSVTTNYTTKPNVVSGEINLPILNQGSVRCIAWNEFGNDT
uniref:Ig-like domain-containing protein n=1 Tax=Poecilia formosa TaxID=48698 RepID=A0A087XGK8_POEFO